MIFFKFSNLFLPAIRKFSSRRLKVLAYHTVPDAQIFKQQIKYLKKTYNIISLKDLQISMESRKSLPENALLITFDDGDYSLYKNAFPILKTYEVPAVIFIISQLIDSEKTFWCRWVEAAFDKEGKSYSEARKEVNRLKKIPNSERMEVLSGLPEIKSRQLSVEELKEMESHNIVMGNHTHTHPMLDQCTSEEISMEMDEVKKNFVQWGLGGYSYFAYPNGNSHPRIEKILKSKGIKMAFLFDHEINTKQINPFNISRIKVDADSQLDEFKAKVSGLHSELFKLKNKLIRSNE